MRILHVMGGNEEGGLEKHVIELVNALAEDPDDQVMLAAHTKYQPRVSAQVTFIPVDLSRSRRSPLALWALWRAVTQHKPDIIHAQAGKAMAMIATLNRWLKIPTIATVHNQKKKHLGADTFSSIVTVSAGLAEQIHHPWVRTIYNGIIPPQPHAETVIKNLRRELHPTSCGRLWLSVGRLVPAKGFDVLLEAMTKVPSGHLLIAGDGPEEHSLKALSKRLALQNRVTFLGHRADISALMAASDGVIIASRREGFSYVFCEAIMQGSPVISTNVPIPNELLPETLICPTEDPVALAQLINHFDPSNSDHHQVRHEAKLKLTIPAMARATRELYNEVVLADRQGNRGDSQL